MTIMAILTPAGQSALATLALAGPQAWAVVRAHFAPTLPQAAIPGRVWFGKLGGEVADEVVLACQGANHVEVHCHGGREVVSLLVELFAGAGLTPVTWEEFLLRTQPPLQARASIALTQATTPRVAAILLDQYRGALATALGQVDSLREAARWSPLGRKLVSGFRVVLAGPPNVGKSSLANALAGYQRSITAATPGTTRDVVTTQVALDGWPVELLDTAGLRDDADALERAGIDRTRATLAEADLVVWLRDATDPASPPPELPALVVVNKIDLPAAWAIPADALTVSATTGQGLDALVAGIVARLVPAVPPPGTAVPFTPELADVVAELLGLHEAGRTVDFERVRLSWSG